MLVQSLLSVISIREEKEWWRNMFQNIETLWIEILVLVLALGFVATIIGVYIYKKIHHLPTGECEICHKSKKQLLKEYHACYGKKIND